MDYSYYPGCSLSGSAKRLDKGVKRVFEMIGIGLTEIPDWNCCGAFEFGNRNELIEMSRKNLRKAIDISMEIVAPCPACAKNLREAVDLEGFTVYHPLDLFDVESFLRLNLKRDLRGLVLTPYYGCLLLRPEETAIKNKNIMEEFIVSLGGEVEGDKVKDRCCGGNKLFIQKDVTEKLSRIILEKSGKNLVVFCPLCHMALKTFSSTQKILYFTDLILYVLGEKKHL